MWLTPVRDHRLEQHEARVCRERYDAVIRGLMTILYGVLIKVMCVGLFPYEHDILHSIATGLAYSPMKCTGCTSSVQIPRAW